MTEQGTGMLDKLKLKQFCCCCSVRTGSLVIGTLGWLMALSGTSSMLEALQKHNQAEDATAEDISSAGSIVSTIISFSVSVALVIGIYKEKRAFMLPWLVIHFLGSIVLTIIFIVVFFALFVIDEVGFMFLLFVICGGITALYWYCVLCVWTYYQELGEARFTISQMEMTMTIADPNKPYYEYDTKIPEEMV